MSSASDPKGAAQQTSDLGRTQHTSKEGSSPRLEPQLIDRKEQSTSKRETLLSPLSNIRGKAAADEATVQGDRPSAEGRPKVYNCALCGRGFSDSQAHARHMLDQHPPQQARKNRGATGAGKRGV